VCVRAHPCIQEARTLECGFETGALVCGDMVSKLQQLPEGRPGALHAVFVAPYGQRRRRDLSTAVQEILLAHELGVLHVESCFLLRERALLVGQLRLHLGVRLVEQAAQRVLPEQRGHPVGQV